MYYFFYFGLQNKVPFSLLGFHTQRVKTGLRPDFAAHTSVRTSVTKLLYLWDRDSYRLELFI